MSKCYKISASNILMSVILLLCSGNNVSEFYSTCRIKFQVDLTDTEFISSVQLCLRKLRLPIMNNMLEIVVEHQKTS